MYKNEMVKKEISFFKEAITRKHLYQSFFILLLPVFFVLHGYNENFGLIPVSVAVWLLLRYLLLCVAILFFYLFIFKSLEKSALFSFFLLMIFFFFGAFHDTLKLYFPGSRIISYSWLLPLITGFSAVIFFWIKRRRKINSKFLQYLYLLMQILCFVEGVLAIVKIAGKAERENNLSGDSVPLTNVSCNYNPVSQPDIFFVVLDGYTNSKVLKEEFRFDNYVIDSLLDQNGFFNSHVSKSNYNITTFSIASTLNFSYLKRELGYKLITEKTFLQAIATLKNNETVSFLRQRNYSIINIGCFDFNEAPAPTVPYFDDYYVRSINDQTISGRIKRDIWWNFTIKNILTGSFRVPESYLKRKEYHLYRNDFNMSRLVDELSSDKDYPRFVYAHLMLPHEPFYLDSSGKQVADSLVINKLIPMKQGYLSQLIYTNKLLREIIASAGRTSNRERVIVIQGDHGFRNYEDKSVQMEKMFANLNAIYFSDKDYKEFYNGISPVNTVRIILNKYFCQSLPLLKDSSIYLIEKNSLH